MIKTEEEYDLLMKKCHELFIPDHVILQCIDMFPKTIDDSFLSEFVKLYDFYNKLLLKKIFNAKKDDIMVKSIIMSLKEMKE